MAPAISSVAFIVLSWKSLQPRVAAGARLNLCSASSDFSPGFYTFSPDTFCHEHHCWTRGILLCWLNKKTPTEVSCITHMTIAPGKSQQSHFSRWSGERWLCQKPIRILYWHVKANQVQLVFIHIFRRWLEENKFTIKNNVYSREYSHRYNSRGADLKYK